MSQPLAGHWSGQPGLRYNFISHSKRPANLAEKFPNLLDLASPTPSPFLPERLSCDHEHYSDPKKDCYGTQIKGKTKFSFWAESRIRYADAAFILTGCSRLYLFINLSHWTEVLSRISESAVSACWYWELKFALTGRVRNFTEKVVLDK